MVVGLWAILTDWMCTRDRFSREGLVGRGPAILPGYVSFAVSSSAVPRMNYILHGLFAHSILDPSDPRLN
jgi:hypothetical protein